MTFDPTPNLGLKKLDYGSAAWDADEHTNADKIDAAVPNMDTDGLFLLRDVAGNQQLAKMYALPYPLTTLTDVASVATGTEIIMDLSGVWPDQGSSREFADPASWVRDTPYVSSWWAGTFPANTLLELPPGHYNWYTRWLYELVAGGPPPDANAFLVNFDVADEPGTRAGTLGGTPWTYGIASNAPFVAYARDSFPGLQAANKAEGIFRGDLHVNKAGGVARVFPSFVGFLAANIHIVTVNLQIYRVG